VLLATRHAGASTALRLLSRALPFVPRSAGALLAPYAAPDTDYGKTAFAIVAQARRGFSAAQVTVRLHQNEADRTRETAKLVRLPYCTLGDVSLFDSPETYAQLDRIIEPPGAMREAYAIVELVKRRCR
jgi:hypothetical protein